MSVPGLDKAGVRAVAQGQKSARAHNATNKGQGQRQVSKEEWGDQNLCRQTPRKRSTADHDGFSYHVPYYSLGRTQSRRKGQRKRKTKCDPETGAAPLTSAGGAKWTLACDLVPVP